MQPIALYDYSLRRKAKKMTKRESIVLGNRPCTTLEHGQSFKGGKNLLNLWMLFTHGLNCQIRIVISL